MEEVFGPRPVRQWVLSFPYPLRFLFASKPEAISPVLGIVHRVIAGWLADQAGVPRDTAQCGAVTLIQRFGSALNLNVHFHMPVSYTHLDVYKRQILLVAGGQQAGKSRQ